MSLSLLPTVNALLNTTSAILLIFGYGFIRRERVGAHKFCMLTACLTSALFLVSYLYYHYHHGTTYFEGQGWVRTVYFSVLISHTALAAILPILVGITLYRALKGQFQKHKAIARWTLPVWIYVSITGVMVYWMLYRVTY